MSVTLEEAREDEVARGVDGDVLNAEAPRLTPRDWPQAPQSAWQLPLLQVPSPQEAERLQRTQSQVWPRLL